MNSIKTTLPPISEPDACNIKYFYRTRQFSTTKECIGLSTVLKNGINKNLYIEFFNNTRKDIKVEVTLENRNVIPAINSHNRHSVEADHKFVMQREWGKLFNTATKLCFNISGQSDNSQKLVIGLSKRIVKTRDEKIAAIFCIFINGKRTEKFFLKAKSHQWLSSDKNKISLLDCFNPYYQFNPISYDSIPHN